MLKNKEFENKFSFIILSIFYVFAVSIYVWCLLSAYANYASSQSDIISSIMLFAFGIEVILYCFVLPKMKWNLQYLLQAITISVCIYASDEARLFIFAVVALVYFVIFILKNDSQEVGVYKIGKIYLISFILLELIYIFRLAGGSTDNTYKKSIIALILVVISYVLILAKNIVAKPFNAVKKIFSKSRSKQEKVLSESEYGIEKISNRHLHVLCLLMSVYIVVLSIGMILLDDEKYHNWIFPNYNVKVIESSELFGNDDMLYQIVKNEDGSISSCGTDPQIFVVWENFDITEVPHNINIIITSMTYYYERGQLFYIDNETTVCRDLDLKVGENNIPLENLESENEFIRIDLTNYDAANFMIPEVRINDYMPYVRKIKECSLFLLGLSLLNSVILVVYMFRRKIR